MIIPELGDESLFSYLEMLPDLPKSVTSVKLKQEGYINSPNIINIKTIIQDVHLCRDQKGFRKCIVPSSIMYGCVC